MSFASLAGPISDRVVNPVALKVESRQHKYLINYEWVSILNLLLCYCWHYYWWPCCSLFLVHLLQCLILVGISWLNLIIRHICQVNSKLTIFTFFSSFLPISRFWQWINTNFRNIINIKLSQVKWFSSKSPLQLAYFKGVLGVNQENFYFASQLVSSSIIGIPRN